MAELCRVKKPPLWKRFVSVLATYPVNPCCGSRIALRGSGRDCRKFDVMPADRSHCTDNGRLVTRIIARNCSVLLPVGGALFEKSADSLGGVRDHHVLDHHRAGMGIGLIETHFDLVIEGAFSDTHGRAELACDL